MFKDVKLHTIVAVVQRLHPRPIVAIPAQLVDSANAWLANNLKDRGTSYAGFNRIVALSEICDFRRYDTALNADQF